MMSAERLNPYGIVPEENFDYNALQFNNYWFPIKPNYDIRRALSIIFELKTEHVLVDCTRGYPQSSYFGFLKDLIGRTLNNKCFQLIQCYTEFDKLWTKINMFDRYEFDIGETIYDFFEKIEQQSIKIIYIIPDFHLIEDKISDNEFYLLFKNSVSFKNICFWFVSDTFERNLGHYSTIKKSFLNFF